jgi:putative PIN family toxin of toxin-antitoxin system
VLDTDVLVAAVRSRSGASSQLVDGALAGEFTLLLSVPLVLEYEAVLTRPEHLIVSGQTVGDIHFLINSLIDVSEPVHCFYLWRPLLLDPTDDMVLETAVNGTADGLVTFNQRHFMAAVQLFECSVMVPSEALRLLRLQKHE